MTFHVLYSHLPFLITSLPHLPPSLRISFSLFFARAALFSLTLFFSLSHSSLFPCSYSSPTVVATLVLWGHVSSFIPLALGSPPTESTMYSTSSLLIHDTVCTHLSIIIIHVCLYNYTVPTDCVVYIYALYTKLRKYLCAHEIL